MNRRFYILTLLSALCCLLIFTLYPSFRLTYTQQRQQLPNAPPPYTLRDGQSSSLFGGLFQKKKAFATIICDRKMVEPTLVSIYSLITAYANKPTSKSDIIVLLPDSIELNQKEIEQLEKLGTNVIRTSNTSNKDANTCDSTLLNLWALLDYQKIVYFTPDVIFDTNVDQLFNYPAGSSALTTIYNTPSLPPPFLILEPNPNSFEQLLRQHRKQLPVSQLLQQSNLIDYKLQLTENELRKNTLVYSGPMRPWNFHLYQDNDWKKYYDPVSFYNWRRISNDIRRLFNPHPEWNNVARQQTVCDAYLQSTANISNFPVQDQFSVMISTYNPERIEHLSLIIRHLLKSPMVHTVFVTWHNPNLDVPASLYADLKQTDLDRVKVLSQSFDSLNNRFNPTQELKTDAVYIMDDDIFIDLNDLEFTFSVWQARKDSVVGHFPRIHTYNAESQVSTYRLPGNAPYSIILTKSMFIRSEYLFSYTCLLEPEMHASVDGQLNCEDLGFAMMASGISGAAPTYVRTQKAMEDFGLKKGISTNNKHMPARAQCITDFITKYWYKNDPLVKSYDAVSPFVRPQIRTGNWDRVEKLV